MLVSDADDPHRLHRKKDPSGYAKGTVNSVLRNLGLKNLMHEDTSGEYHRWLVYSRVGDAELALLLPKDIANALFT